MIKERIMQLAKEGWIILDLDDVAEANHVSSKARELCTLQFGNLELVFLIEPWLLSPSTEERPCSAAILNRATVNMTSCSELEEETNEESDSKENCSEEIDKTMASLEAMPKGLNWGRLFSFPSETHQHMVIALQHLEIQAGKVKTVVEMA